MASPPRVGCSFYDVTKDVCVLQRFVNGFTHESLQLCCVCEQMRQGVAEASEASEASKAGKAGKAAQGPVACGTCDVRFASHSALRRHERSSMRHAIQLSMVLQ